MGGVVGYLYQSAKDSIRWHNQKPKEFINLIMGIGNLRYLSDDEWNKLENENEILPVDAETLRNMYAEFRKSKEN